MTNYTTKIVKLRIYEPELWSKLMRGETVAVTLQHSGYRDGTEAELICGEKQ